MTARSITKALLAVPGCSSVARRHSGVRAAAEESIEDPHALIFARASEREGCCVPATLDPRRLAHLLRGSAAWTQASRLPRSS